MSEEIKSAKAVASAHVDSIKSSNAEFVSVGEAPPSGLQINKPTEAMRAVFENANTACEVLSGCLGRDAGRILLMADEFEKWDSQAGNAHEERR